MSKPDEESEHLQRAQESANPLSKPDQSGELNKYGVPVWLVEAMKSYDGLMSTPKGNYKDAKMKAKRQLGAAIQAHLDAAVREELEELSMAVIHPCEPDCTPELHAFHEGSWQAHLVIESRLAHLTKDKEKP